jgi:hypothetical protein
VEWIQIQLAYPIQARELILAGAGLNHPAQFALLGSNNGTLWYLVHRRVEPTTWDVNSTQKIRVDSPAAYEYYRVVIESIFTSKLSPSDRCWIGAFYITDSYSPVVAHDDLHLSDIFGSLR